MADGGVLDLMTATGPSPEHRERLMLFGRLVGSWAVTSTRFDEGGATGSAEGEWHFAWVLGGRGVQDVLFSSGPTGDDHSAALRCYDPAIDAWHVTWMHPAAGEFVHMKARSEEERIVLEGLDVRNGRPCRSFFDAITAGAFVWRGQALAEDGTTWAVRREITARRTRG